MMCKGTSDKVKGLKNKFFDLMIFPLVCPLVCPLVKWTPRGALFRKDLEPQFYYFWALYMSSTNILTVQVNSIHVVMLRLG